MNAGRSGLPGDNAVDKSAVGEAVVGEIHGYPLHADDAAQWQAAGDAAARGTHAAAADVIQTLCDRRPHLLPARIQAGYYRLSAGAYRTAESIALAAADACADAPPRTPEAAAALIALLRVFEAHQAMAEVVDRTNWSPCRDPGALAKIVVEQGLNVRQTERLVQADKNTARSRQTPEKDANTRALERELSQRIGLQVTLKTAGNGGTLSIAYHSLDQLEEVVARLRDGRSEAGEASAEIAG